MGRPVKVKVDDRKDVFYPLAMDGKPLLDMLGDFSDMGIHQVVTFTEDVGRKPIAMSADIIGMDGVEMSMELLANHLLVLFATEHSGQYTRVRANTWYPVYFKHWENEEEFEAAHEALDQGEDPDEYMRNSPDARSGWVCIAIDDTGWVESWIVPMSINDDGKAEFGDEADLMWQGHIDEVGEDGDVRGGMLLSYKAILDKKQVMFTSLRDSILADFSRRLMNLGETELLNRMFEILQHERWIEVLAALGGTIASDAFYYGTDEDKELEELVGEMVKAVELTAGGPRDEES